MSRGVLFDRGSRKRLKVSRFRAFDTIETATESFAGKAMIKGAFSHGIQTGVSKRHRRALPSSHGGFAERFCDRRFVSGTIQRWFSGLCRVGREVKERGDGLLGRVEMTCQRKTEKGLEVASWFRENVAALQEEGRGQKIGAERHA
jgi:hypothetical protein